MAKARNDYKPADNALKNFNQLDAAYLAQFQQVAPDEQELVIRELERIARSTNAPDSERSFARAHARQLRQSLPDSRR